MKKRKTPKPRNIAVPLIKRSEVVHWGKEALRESYEDSEVCYLSQRMTEDILYDIEQDGDSELMIIKNEIPRDNAVRATILIDPDTGARIALDMPLRAYMGLPRRVLPEAEVLAIRKQKYLRFA